MVTVNTTR